jgi:catechol 2,3-dioxygenase-like lactoylglutathione lyase family enzyme
LRPRRDRGHDEGVLARRLSHVSFAVRDLARAMRFYRDLLGLEPIPRPDFGFPGAWLAAGDVQIHLIEVPAGTEVGTPSPVLTPIANHTAFVVADHADTVARLRGLGLEIVDGGAMGQSWVQDPDGNVIEFIAEGAR